MTTPVKMHEAKTHLSGLVARRGGRTIVIAIPDRLLMAQAQSELANKAVFNQFGVQRLW